MKSGNSKISSIIDIGSKIATIVILGFAIYSILQVEKTIEHNNNVTSQLTAQIEGLEKIIQYQRASVVNSYSQFEPFLDFRIHPVNNTSFSGSENKFRLDIRNTGPFGTEGKIVWDFYGKCYSNDVSFKAQKVESSFNVPTGETDVTTVDIPIQFVNNLPNLHSIVAQVGIISYPFDSNVKRIEEQERYRQTIMQFDYNSTYQKWFASKAFESDVCIIPEIGSFVYSFHTSDEKLNHYAPRP